VRAFLRLAVLVGLVWAQIWSVLTVARLVGWGWTLLAVAACVVGGLWLVSRQGAAVARRARADLMEGRPGTDAAADGLLVLGAGALLLVPGFVTAALGFALLVPPVRARLRRPLLSWWSRRTARGAGRVVSGGFGPGGFGPGVFRFETVVVDGGFPGPGTPFDRPGDQPVVEAEVVDVEVHRPLELPAGDADDEAPG
jgi:UPF0716 protein FxsA